MAEKDDVEIDRKSGELLARDIVGLYEGPPLLSLARDAVKSYRVGTKTVETNRKMGDLEALIDRIDNARAALRRFEDRMYGDSGECSGPDSGSESPSVP